VTPAVHFESTVRVGGRGRDTAVGHDCRYEQDGGQENEEAPRSRHSWDRRSRYAAAPALGAEDGDREIAKAGVFQAADFPAGWRATPQAKPKDGPNDCPALAEAVGGTGKRRTPEVRSDEYKLGKEQYSAAVSVYRSGSVARRAYKATASRDMRRCITRSVEEQWQGVKVKVEAGTRTGIGSYGDESSGLRLRFTASRGPFGGNLFNDIVFVRVGRALGMYSHVSDKEESTCRESSSPECVTGLTNPWDMAFLPDGTMSCSRSLGRREGRPRYGISRTSPA
jgi:hypothetical protein